MAKLDVFVAPQPWPAFSKFMSRVNRVAMLHGIPILRDFPVLKRIPLICGLTDIRFISVAPSEIIRLREICQSRSATFIVPNHPEFFTDWMIDKELIDRCCPQAASWATNGVVNGMGDTLQKFWLWNNIMAQIPGNSSGAKEHSINWALQGKSILLHPEGAVGWHSNWVAPLMNGAAEMAIEAKRRAPDQPSNLIPIAWKLEYTEDATTRLANECSYVEKKLKVERIGQSNPAQRIHDIYDALLDREMRALDLNFASSMPVLVKRKSIEQIAGIMLDGYLGQSNTGISSEARIKLVRKKARTDPTQSPNDPASVFKLCDRLSRIIRLGDFAGERVTITQEEVGEHIKRVRNDFCKGTLRDTLNTYLPQPAARRTCHIKILEPIEVTAKDDPISVMALVRLRLQSALNEINAEIDSKPARRTWDNPFYIK